MILKVQW